MAFTEEQSKEIEETIRKKFSEFYNQGIKVGVLTVSKVVLDKLNDSSKPLMKRIDEVKKFCEAPLNKDKESKELKSSNISNDKND